MASTNRQEHVRFRYGLCLNESCSKCKSKEVQQLSARKEFVCAECGKALRECPPPKTWMQKHGKKLYAGIGALVVAAGIGAGVTMSGGDKAEPEKPKAPETAVTDTTRKDTAKVDTTRKATPEPVKKPEKTKETPETDKGGTTTSKPKAPKHTPGERYQGTLNLGYGTYSGEIVDGKPDGAGTLRYTSSQKVVSSKDVMAESGDRIEGVFENGKPSFVTLYKKDGSTIKVHR